MRNSRLYNYYNEHRLDTFVGNSPIENVSLIHNSCDQKCIHCGWSCLSNQTALQGLFSFRASTAAWKSILKWCAQRQVAYVIFSGGEPTLRKDFHNLVIDAQWHGLRVVVETNGQKFANSDYCRLFSPGKQIRYVISIHGATAKVHDNITQVPGSFEKTLQGIRNLTNYTQSRIDLITVLSKYNLDTVIDTFKLFEDIGIYSHFFVLMMLRGQATPDKLPPMGQLKDVIDSLLEKSKESKTKVFFNNLPLCFLNDEIIKSINYQAIQNRNKCNELLLYPDNLERSFLGKMTLPTPLSYPDCCTICFFRDVCPAPSYIHYFENPYRFVQPFTLLKQGGKKVIFKDAHSGR